MKKDRVVKAVKNLITKEYLFANPINDLIKKTSVKKHEAWIIPFIDSISGDYVWTYTIFSAFDEVDEKILQARLEENFIQFAYEHAQEDFDDEYGMKAVIIQMNEILPGKAACKVHYL